MTADVDSGAEAIERALEVRPDLVLLDIRLPGELNGLDVARRLRAGGFDAPMVALSALSKDEVWATAAEAGVSAFLEKPIDPFAVVREVMHRIGHAAHNRRER